MDHAQSLLGIAPAAAIAHARSLLQTNPAGAAAQAREVLRVLPDDARALTIIAAAQRLGGAAADGLRMVRAILAQRPDIADAQAELGFALIAAGEAGAALEAWRAAARLPFRDAFDWRDAIVECRLALQDDAARIATAEWLRPGLARVETQAACDALRGGRPRDAAAILSGRRRGDPDAAAGHIQALAAMALGKPEAAVAFLDNAPFADADAGDAMRRDLIAALIACREPEAAMRHLMPLRAAAPHDLSLTLFAAQCGLLLGDGILAAEHGKILLSRRPGHQVLLSLFASVTATA